ncbi:MAG TPA: SDR family NAD(P)-dependent oxidoreductase [Acidimicrobiales bacterium]|jgi:NAD(P)-dependent dehydrogenase (short-subunit alcohol dehydrogenase family)|nr:SDR family NAD(P)-dependent oxidoreductase [Acidimicrobiales bacterium]
MQENDGGKPLTGKVALVTGASRGIGKGIALELGAAGATVYVTARSVKPGFLPGTVNATAAEIDELGGHGIAVPCDHADDEQVAAVFERITYDHGDLDVLVNNVYDAPGSARWLGKPFWEVPARGWDETFRVGVRSHYVASVLAAPLLMNGLGGLIVNVSSPGAISYSHNVVYGVGKAAIDRMTADMAHELAPHLVSVVSIWPGIVNTELLQTVPPDAEGKRVLRLPGEGEYDLALAESPHFAGRAVVALAGDGRRAERSGQAFYIYDLARSYGFTDIDGRVPEPWGRGKD